MNETEQNHLSRFFDRVPQAASLVAVIVGVSALLGWAFDLGVLKSVAHGLPPMQLNVAVALVLAGISLWTACPKAPNRFFQQVSQACSGAVLLIGLAMIGEYLTGMDFGIDQALVRDTAHFPGDTLGGMPLRIAACLVMLALSLWLLVWDSRTFAKTVQVLAFTVEFIAIFGLVGYVYDINALHQGRYAFSPMELNTAATLALLGIGITHARRAFLFRRVITSDSVAGKAARLLFPVITGFPFVVGLLIVHGYQAGYFSEAVGMTLFAVANMGGLSALALWGADTLLTIDTRRTQAEKQLRSALLYTRNLIEASLDPLVTINLEGKITDVNEATVQATGMDREMLVGSDFSDYFTEPDLARAGYQEVFAKDVVRDYPLTLRHVSGKLTGVLYNASVYHNEKGEVAGVFAAARDITQLKAAEQEAMQLSLRNQLILDSAGEGIYGLDINGLCTFINPAALQMLGFTVNELVGQHSHSMFHHTKQDGNPYPPEECPVLAAYQQGVAHRGVDRYWRKDGSSFPVEFVSTPTREAEQRITGAVVVFHDITERKLLEREREQYFKFFRLSIDPMCIADPFGCFKQVNPAFVLLTQFEESELLAKPFMDFILPEDRQSTLAEMELQVTARPSLNFENRYLCKDGRAVALSWTAYFDKNDGVTYATARDITERKRAEQELLEYQGHLEELVRERTIKLETANQDLESFAYSVSHDLRVPLRAVDGFSLQVLKRHGDKLDDEGKRYLNVVRDNTKKMSQLIDDILAFSRMGRLEMTLSETDTEAMVRDVLEDLKPGFDGRKLALEIKPLPRCHGDQAMLRQVWVNLLNNAIKFTRPKALALVEVGAYTEGTEIIYYIKDNGAGFDMHYADKLFGVFQRLHGVEEFEGTGIGLAIIKRIITRHGGRVWAEGKVDEGATFYFALPTIKNLTV